MNYKVNLLFDTKLGNQLLHIRKFIKAKEESIIFDFAGAYFLSPLIASYFTIEYNRGSKTKFETLSNYHKQLFFPSGLQTNDIQFFQKYINKNFLPLIKFTTERNSESSTLRERILSTIGNIISSNFSLNHKTGLIYIISELTDNIVDHAKAGFGFITSSRFTECNFLDICIADGGIGVIGAYQQYKLSDKYSYVDNSVIALDSLIKGFSTKAEYHDERGFGVHTSRRMLIEGMGGTFILLKGNALMYNYEISDFKAFYPGTIILLRIPINGIDANFNYLDYVN